MPSRATSPLSRRIGGALLALLVVFVPGEAAEPKLSLPLRQAITADPWAIQVAWVFFTDKGPDAIATSADPEVSARASARRALRGQATNPEEDRPVARAYVDAVRLGALRVRQQSRWFNAVSVEATPSQLQALSELPFVSRVDLVRRMNGSHR